MEGWFAQCGAMAPRFFWVSTLCIVLLTGLMVYQVVWAEQIEQNRQLRQNAEDSTQHKELPQAIDQSNSVVACTVSGHEMAQRKRHLVRALSRYAQDWTLKQKKSKSQQLDARSWQVRATIRFQEALCLVQALGALRIVALQLQHGEDDAPWLMMTLEVSLL